MACAHPIVVKTKSGSVRVACRQCLPCRVAYQSALCFSATLELQKVYANGQGASFCCVTYNDDFIPGSPYRSDDGRNVTYGSLYKRDIQLLYKRIRESLGRKKWNTFKHVTCGEYGDTFGRCHYHMLLIGLCDMEADALLRKHWKYGLIDAQALGKGGLRYVTKYCTKQITGEKAVELYDSQGLERPFLIRSVRLGYDYLNKNILELTNNNFHYNKNGKMVPIPSYYRKLLDRYKTFDSSSVLSSMQSVANTLGMDFHTYQDYHNRNIERLLIQSVRESGLPVDDHNYNLGGNVFTRLSSVDPIVALDPIPF